MRTEMKTLAADFSSVVLLDDAAAKWHERRARSSFAAMRRRAWVIASFACAGPGGVATWRVFLTTRFGEFVEKARAEFDSVVIDSPRAMVVADAAILARFADVVLHVVRWARTRRTAVIDGGWSFRYASYYRPAITNAASTCQ